MYFHLDQPKHKQTVTTQERLTAAGTGSGDLVLASSQRAWSGSGGYQFRRVGTATATNPAGPYTFVRGFQPDGIPSLDMNLFRDPLDGQAYLIRDCAHQYVGISRLSPDYLNTTGAETHILSCAAFLWDTIICQDRLGPRTRKLEDKAFLSAGVINKIPDCEGMAMIRLSNGTYYLITSHKTGWNPNPLIAWRSTTTKLDTTNWTNLGNPTGSDTSFNSQPTFVVQYTPTSGQPYFIYMGDDCEYLGYSLLLSSTQTFPGRTTLSLQGPAFYLVTRVTGAHTPATTLTLRALICCATGVHCPNADGSEGPLVNACYVWLPIEMHTNGAGPTGLPLQINNYANWSLDNPFSPAGLRPQPPAPPSPPPAPTPVPPGPPQPTPKGYTQHMGQYCSDHGGKQIFTLHMPTLAECAAQCSTNAACKCFDWEQPSSDCRGTTDVDLKKSSGHKIAFTKTPPPPPPPPSTPMLIDDNQAMAGTAMTASASASASAAHTYTYRRGEIERTSWNVFHSGTYSQQQAEEFCSKSSSCVGFTYRHASVDYKGARQVVFLNSSIAMNNHTAWSAIRDYQAPQVRSTVFSFGEGGWPCIRAPAITLAGDGVLLAFAACRNYTGDGCYPQTPATLAPPDPFIRPEHVCMKRSIDSGHTWSNLSFPFGQLETSEHPGNTTGCATVLYDPTRSQVVLQGCSPTVATSPGLPHVSSTIQAISRDNGLSWSPPQRLDGRAQGLGKGRGLILLRGPRRSRLLWLGSAAGKGVVWYSDDGGQTYSFADAPHLEGIDEAMLVELHSPPGAVLLNSRSENPKKDPKGSGERLFARSTDSGYSFGAITADDKSFDCPPTMGSVLSIQNAPSSASSEDDDESHEGPEGNPAATVPVIYFSNPNTPRSRQNLTIFRSFDDAKTWPAEAQTRLYDGLGGYSCLTTLPAAAAADENSEEEGSLGIMWETGAEHSCVGSACRMVFSVFDKEAY